MQAEKAVTYDAAVIGGGVVGLAVLREMAVHGYRVALIEKEAHLVAGAASSGNSGIGCTGYDAPAGSLERALLRRSIQRHPELMRSLGFSYRHVNKCGALVIAQSRDQLSALQEVVHANAAAGDLEAVEISRAELLRREPTLAPNVQGAVVVPREVVVEPWLIPIAYAQAAIRHGADIFTDQHIVTAEFRSDAAPIQDGRGGSEAGPGCWQLRSSSGHTFHARAVINCAGLYGDDVERTCLEQEAPFQIRPRKGQFVIMELDDQRPVHVLQPVPTQHSKGVFVWTTLWGTVVVGPTAEDQLSKTDRSVDPPTTDRLIEHARSLVPALSNARVIGSYSGLRPATQFRDYQIRAIPSQQWISVGGIRSTGLTASPGIAEYVTFLFSRMNAPPTASNPSCGAPSEADASRRASAPPSCAPETLSGWAFSPDYLPILRHNAQHSMHPPHLRTPAPTHAAAVPPSGEQRKLGQQDVVYMAPVVESPSYTPTPLYPQGSEELREMEQIPSLAALAHNYAQRGDGCLEVFGRTWKVTHPLTHHGLVSLARRQARE
jgi:glycerol-3-phosphate dehydrogenase